MDSDKEVSAITITDEREPRLQWVRVLQEPYRAVPVSVGDTSGFVPRVYAGTLAPVAGQRFQFVDGSWGVVVATKDWPADAPTESLRDSIAALKARGIWLPGFAGDRPPGAAVPGSLPAKPAATDVAKLHEYVHGAFASMNAQLVALRGAVLDLSDHLGGEATVEHATWSLLRDCLDNITPSQLDAQAKEQAAGFGRSEPLGRDYHAALYVIIYERIKGEEG